MRNHSKRDFSRTQVQGFTMAIDTEFVPFKIDRFSKNHPAEVFYMRDTNSHKQPAEKLVPNL